MNACSERCAWCGACTDDRTTVPPARDYLFCDRCGKDAIHPVTMPGVGIACSWPCMSVLEAQYSSALIERDRVRRGLSKVPA